MTLIREKTTSPFVFTALFSTIFLVIFNYTLTMMAGIYITSDLGGGHFISTYSVTFYSIGNAIGVPLGRALVGHVGAVRLLIITLLLFAFFSLMCALSSYFFLFVGFRFLQGLVSGPFYTLINRLLSALGPPEKKSLFTSILLTIFTVVPVLGACFGGWIAYDYNWRYNFYINIPIVAAIVFILIKDLRDFEIVIPEYVFDFIGYISYFIGVFFLGFVLTTGQEFDWFRSPSLVWLTILGVTSFLFFILWSLRHPQPILDFRLFKKPVFSFALFNLAFLFSAYFGMVILLAFWLSLYVNYTPYWIAIILGTMAVAGLLPTFLIAKRVGESDCRIPLLIALVFLAVSSFHTSLFNVDINFGRIAFSRILAGFGLAFFLPPIFRLCFHSYPEEKGIDIVVAFQFVRALASGLGASLYVILWQRREVFYHERLGGLLTPFSAETKKYFSQAKQFGLQGMRAKEELDILLERESISLALDDCFYFMGWIMIILTVILMATFFFKSSPFCPEAKKRLSQE